MDLPNMNLFIAISIAVILTILAELNDGSDNVKQNVCGRLITNGYTVPDGDIILSEGDALDLTCHIYENLSLKYGADAVKWLYFDLNNNSISDFVEILNETAIRLHIKNVTRAENDNYYCLFKPPNEHKNELICRNVVFVGVAPQEVTDFSCVSKNRDNMTCSWSVPNNYLKTDYKLMYKLKDRPVRFNSCNPFQMDDKMTCFYNLSTTPAYQPVYDTYYFTLFMNNSLGNRTLEYTFEHFKRVVPNPPENLKVEATSPHSAHLSWTIPKGMIAFPPGVYHRINYFCEKEYIWKQAALIKDATHNETMEYDVTGLKYAHCNCTFVVALVSAEAYDHDTSPWWSINASKTIVTKNKIPDSPPDTAIGSFDINQQKNSLIIISVYWKQLSEDKKNGQDFKYALELIKDDSNSTEEEVEVSKIMHDFENLENSNYTIKIWSKNEEGKSDNYSVIKIPSSRMISPTYFKVAKDEKDYELYWEPTKDPVSNYTIFRCFNQLHKCKDNFEWVIVPKNQTNYIQRIVKNRVYQFAISANGYKGSSGMLWSECTVFDRVPRKLSDVSINAVGHNFIELTWKSLCTDYFKILGYEILYCLNANKDKCKTAKVYGGASIQKVRIGQLEPYTCYTIEMRVIVNEDIDNQWSDEISIRTNQTAPSTPPTNITIISITNSSIILVWDLPAKMNGIFNYSKIYYNSFQFYETQANNYSLENLQSYTTYNISIVACTVVCSSRSEPLHITTDMSPPGNVTTPNLNFINNSIYILSWEQPKYAGGNLDYYQVHFMPKLDAINDTDNIKNVTSMNYSIDCNNNDNDFPYVRVRAVNIINGTEAYGPWSKSFEIKCVQMSSLIYVITGIAFIILSVMLYFGGKKLHNKIYGQKINPEFSPNIQHIINELKEAGNQKKSKNKVVENKKKRNESITFITSLETPIYNEQYLALEMGNRNNSLRQGNLSDVDSTALLDPVISPVNNEDTTALPTSKNNCILNTSLDSCPDSEEQKENETSRSLPHILEFADIVMMNLIKTTNPSYVPFKEPNAAPKKKEYIEFEEVGMRNTASLPAKKDESASHNTSYVECGLSRDSTASESGAEKMILGDLPTKKGGSTPKITSYVDSGLSKDSIASGSGAGKMILGSLPTKNDDSASKNTGYVLAGLSKDLLASKKKD